MGEKPGKPGKWFANGRVKYYLIGTACFLLVVLSVLLGVFLGLPKARGAKAVTPSPATNTGLTYRPIQPPSYPLAVRNPYLSAWMPGPFVANLPSNSPQFWAGQNLTWSVIARVDNTTFNLFGVPDAADGTKSAVVQSAEYTSTHSIFILKAGDAKLTLDFFSPVSPSNYLRQSLPFSYLTISASSLTGSNVEVYSDIDNSWTGKAKDSAWNFTIAGETSLFSMWANNTHTYAQNSMDQALWGETIFASRPSNSSTLSLQSGSRAAVRAQFARNGKLTDDVPSWISGSVIALSQDLGTVKAESSVTLAIGYVRETAINYLGTPYTGYYRSQYTTIGSAVSHFLDDYSAAEKESQSMDAEIASKSIQASGTNYSAITTLSLRQAYGGIDLVIPLSTLNKDDIIMFIKEISSDGNVNTVDIIYPSFPIYYAMDPSYIRLLLEPIMRYLASGRWTQAYAIHDIGSNYPNATGHDDQKAEEMPIEESGNLLILAYAYTLATGNSSWASQYQSIFQKYADYLSKNSINIALQLSTTDAAGPLANETNLAVKAAVGLKAYGALFNASNCTDIGSAHAKLIFEDGLGTDENKTHFTLQYPNNESTYKVIFNLFPDLLLNLSTFPTSAYEMQSSYYPTIHKLGGVALDNRQWWAKSDWNLWCAAVAGDGTKKMFVDDVWKYMSNGVNRWPFSDRWVVASEGVVGAAPAAVGREWALRARPTVGGHFALLAMKGPGWLKW
ncbi:hypothetical protein B0J14DRAFT_296214 [Halenospora varia]|nr:hypothetical protein B0J14DRAFT_296214 [Halenospora varia]